VTGRPSKLTPDLQTEVCRILALGCTITAACGVVGIDETSYQKWRVRGREALEAGHDESHETEGKYVGFLGKTTRALQRFEIGAVENIRRAGKAGDWKAEAWMLARRNPAFRDTSKVELEGEVKATGETVVAGLLKQLIDGADG